VASAAERDQYAKRVVQYMQKALREAKVHTSWINPSEAYEVAAIDFVLQLLSDQGARFRDDMAEFVHHIADSGFVNSLAQSLLKVTLPGVPDFYQGSELWDFNLVDPDNRRPIDFADRFARLNKLHAAANRDLDQATRELCAHWPHADVKLWVIARGLAVRHDYSELFSFGEYIPLAAVGPAADHVISFARQLDEHCVITVVPRHFHRLGGRRERNGRALQADWLGTRLILPNSTSSSWHCALSGRTVEPRAADGQSTLDVGELFKVLPVALLTTRRHKSCST
jgi:(1->4)-alpha-D-glucan 1-alpha-D-glucosylmutase